MGLSKQQIAAGLHTIGNIALTVADIRERDKAKEEAKKERLRQEEKSDLLRTIETEREQRTYDRRVAKEDERYERRQREAEDRTLTRVAIEEEKSGSKERTAQAKLDKETMADPNKRFSLYLQGQYKPATAQEQRYFENLEGKAAKAGTPTPGKTKRRLSNGELYKEWNKASKSKAAAVFGNQLSFKDFYDQYHQTMDLIESGGASDPTGGGGRTGGGAGQQQGTLKQSPTTGNAALDLYNQQIMDSLLEATAAQQAAELDPEDTTGIGEPVNPFDFEPAGEIDPTMQVDSSFNPGFAEPVTTSPPNDLVKAYPQVPPAILQNAAGLRGFRKLTPNQQAMVIDQLLFEATQAQGVQ